MDPVTPDNTKVIRLMGDFRQFMRSAQLRSGQSTDSAPIPFKISAAEDAISQTKPSKRKLEDEKEEIFAKAKLAELECKHVAEERAHKVARHSLESQNEKLQTENKQLNEKITKLQFKLTETTRQAIKAHDELNEMKNSDHSESKNLEESYLELQKAKTKNESSLQTKISKFEAHIHALQQRNTQLISQNSYLQTKLEEKSVLLEQKCRRIETLTENLEDWKTAEKTVREQQMEITSFKMRLSRAEEAEKLAKILKEDFERLQQLDIEVVKLREQNEYYRNNESNVLLMKERMLAMEEKLRRNESILEKSVIVELENRELLTQLNESKNREVQLTENNDTKLVIDLQQKEAIRVHEIGELKTEITLLKKSIEVHKCKISDREKVIAEKTEESNLKDAEIQILKKRNIALQEECTSLRGIMQSYDTEIATPHSEQLMKRVKNTETFNNKLHSQLENARKLVQASSQEVTSLRLKVKELEIKISSLEGKESHSDSTGNTEELRKKVEDLQSEKETLVKRNERLELWAERNIRRGDFDPSQNRVVHFRMNPADLAHGEAKKEVEELRAKCLKLQEKILKLESDQDVTTTCLDTTRIKELEEKLTTAELKNQRLKEVFSKRIQDFRQACYILTGFRIDVVNDDHFKLTSRYAESQQDFLLFASLPAGGMQLLETDFSKTLVSLIKLHLHHQDSIPMFLSSLTAELFGQQTAMTSQFC